MSGLLLPLLPQRGKILEIDNFQNDSVIFKDFGGSFALISPLACLAITNSKTACARMNSGKRMVIAIHLALRNSLVMKPSLGPGTLRCWMLQVHEKTVVAQLTMMSSVPRRPGLLCQPDMGAEYSRVDVSF